MRVFSVCAGHIEGGSVGDAPIVEVSLTQTMLRKSCCLSDSMKSSSAPSLAATVSPPAVDPTQTWLHVAAEDPEVPLGTVGTGSTRAVVKCPVWRPWEGEARGAYRVVRKYVKREGSEGSSSYKER